MSAETAAEYCPASAALAWRSPASLRSERAYSGPNDFARMTDAELVEALTRQANELGVKINLLL
jgi:hypothetical protein